MPLVPGAILILKEKIISPGKGARVYGNARDEVKVITLEYYPVLIVEGKNKDRYPVRVEKTELKPVPKTK